MNMQSLFTDDLPHLPEPEHLHQNPIETSVNLHFNPSA